MKAFVVERYGKNGLRAGEVPEPELRDRDVLVRVRAAGVNPLDSKIRDGEFKLILPYRPPFVLGHEGNVHIGRRGGVDQYVPLGTSRDLNEHDPPGQWPVAAAPPMSLRWSSNT